MQIQVTKYVKQNVKYIGLITLIYACNSQQSSKTEHSDYVDSTQTLNNIPHEQSINNNDVVLKSFDTVFFENKCSQIEILDLNGDEIKIVTNFIKESDSKLSIKNYHDIQISFNGNPTSNIIKNIIGIDTNAILFLPAFQGDSIDNPEGFKFKKINSPKYVFWIVNGYFYDCNGSFCNNGILLILRKDISDDKSNIFLIGVRKDLINWEKSQFLFDKDNLLLKLKPENHSNFAILTILNHEIQLADQKDNTIAKKLFFRIK